MKIIKEYYEKDREELLKELKKNKTTVKIYSAMSMIIFATGYIVSTNASWKIGEIILLIGILLFILTTWFLIEHMTINLLLANKNKEKK